MKRDRCGVCGGDNYSCRTVTGTFNNAIYGESDHCGVCGGDNYIPVVLSPAPATM